MVFPHTTPDGCLVNFHSRAISTREQMPNEKHHDHLSKEKGYFNAATLQTGTGSPWVPRA
jgi:hypothetical protein